MVVLPRSVVQSTLNDRAILPVVPSDVGYFPRAAGHERRREHGCAEVNVILCVAGTGWLETRGGRQTVEPHHLLVIPADVPHAYGASEENPWTIHWCHADGPAAAKFARQLGIQRDAKLIRVTDPFRIVALFEELVETLEMGYAPHHVVQASGVLAHLLTQAASMVAAPVEVDDSAARVSETVRAIQARPHLTLRVPELARKCKLSESQFSHRFKRLTGYPPLDFQRRVRVQRACVLLASTKLSIKEVAGRVGFEDPLYFSRVFSKVQGISPTGFRHSMMGNVDP